MTEKSWAMRQGGMSIAHHLSCQDIENTIREQSTWKILKKDWRHLRWLFNAARIARILSLPTWTPNGSDFLSGCSTRGYLRRGWVCEDSECSVVNPLALLALLSSHYGSDSRSPHWPEEKHRKTIWPAPQFEMAAGPFFSSKYKYVAQILLLSGINHAILRTLNFEPYPELHLPQVKASRQKTGAKMLLKSGTLICRSLQAILVILAMKMSSVPP